MGAAERLDVSRHLGRRRMPDRSKDCLLRMPEVRRRTGLHRATIYRKIARGEFPRGVPLGTNSTGWYESDINAWVASPTGWREAA